MIAIDFETYYASDYSVSTMGYWAYCHSPKFKAYLVSMHGEKGPIYCGDPRIAPWEVIHGQDLVAHNAAFDAAVFDRLRELGFIPETVQPKSWTCTAAASSYLQCPRDLAGAAKAILGVEVSKVQRGEMKGVHPELMSPGMREYAAKDAEICFQLWDRAGRYWPEAEREIWRATWQMGKAGVWFDSEYAQAQSLKLCELEERLLKALPWAGVTAPLSIPAMRAWVTEQGAKPPTSTDTDSPEFREWAKTAPAGCLEAVQSMQTYRRATRALSVLQAMRSRVMDNGRMEAGLLYCGAFTGRWSGGGHGLNLQNLNSDTDLADMRGCLAPKPGNVFIDCDLAQIEARVLLWLVGDEKTLALVRQGMSIYEAHARATMGWTGGMLKKENPNLYKLAKARVLGLGFGCGETKFKVVAQVMAGLDLTQAEAAKTVREYRQANPGIVQLWSTLNDACFNRHGSTYRMKLRSGRTLNYRNVDRDLKTAEQVKGQAARVYGGLLCENMVQATARDVFADRLLALRAAGWAPCMLIHDEYVIEVPESEADDARREIERIVCQAPAWADGLPVGCETQIMRRYQK